MKKIRVFGRPEVVVSTVIEVEDDAAPEEIFKAATVAFQGISQLVGNGGFGDRMIGVNGHGDTIIVDGEPVLMIGWRKCTELPELMRYATEAKIAGKKTTVSAGYAGVQEVEAF